MCGCPWFLIIYPREKHSTSHPSFLVHVLLGSRAIAEAVVGLVRRCLESGQGEPGGVVSRAAGRLLLSLMTVFPSSALERSPAVAALLKESSQVRSRHAMRRYVLLLYIAFGSRAG